MNQDPTMQGGNLPNQGGQPAGNSGAPTTNPAGAPSTASGSAATAATSPNPANSVNNTPNADNGALPSWMNSTPDPVATGLPNGSVVEPATPPKKKHTGLIITLVILFILILAGAGVAVWYFCFYNNPENVAYEAVDGFLHQKSIALTGAIQSTTEDSLGDKTTITLGLNNSASAGAGTSELNLNVTNVEDDEESSVSLRLGTVQMSDGVIYLKISKIMESLDAYLESNQITRDEFDYSMELIYSILEKVDDQWWRISIPELLDEIAPSSEEAQPVKDLYACMVDLAKQDTSGEFATIYRDNRFIKIEKVSQTSMGDIKPKSGNSLYLLDYDYEKMANFINALPDTAVANAAYDCYNDYIDSQDPQRYLDEFDISMSAPKHLSASDFEKVNAEDLRKSRENSKTNAKQYLEISNFGHELKGVYAHFDKTDSSEGYDIEYGTDIKPYSQHSTGLLQLNFSYEPVTVTAPDDYRPITELVEEIINVITQYISDLYNSYYTPIEEIPEGWVFDYDQGYYYNPENPDEHTNLPIDDDFPLDWEA